MLKKLRLKFICITMAIVTIMLCVIFGLVYGSTSQSLARASVTMLQQLAEDPFRPESASQQFSQMPQPYFAVQYTTWGQITAIGGYYDLNDAAFLSQVIQEAAASDADTGVLRSYHLRFYRTQHGQICYLLFADISSEITTLQHLVRTCLVIGALSLLLFLGLSILLARWAVRPVEAAWQQQRQFVADASHELKTPLTVILTNAELLQGPASTPDRTAHAASSILTMARQMRALVEQLLTLARADSGSQRPALTPLDLSQLIQTRILPFEALFYERGLRLRDEIADGLRVSGDAQTLGQVVDILLDNAQKYATGGEVIVRLQPQSHGRCLLTVTNEAPPLSQAELANLFKRFYRADPARSASGSFGLGLAIASQAVEAHHGRIWAACHGSTITFSVLLRQLP